MLRRQRDGAVHILAIDPASTMGVADGVLGGTPALSTVRLRKDADDGVDDIFGRAGKWIWQRLRDGPAFAVLAIEKPIPPLVSRDFDSTRIGMGLDGLLTGVVRAAGIRVMHAPIRTWRKRVLGNGALPGDKAKRLMIAQCKALGWPAAGHDEAEAAGIWIWACSEIKQASLFDRAA